MQLQKLKIFFELKKNQLVQKILVNPKKSFLIGILIFLSFLPGFTLLQSDFTSKVWYNEKDPLLKVFQGFEKKFGNDTFAVIAVFHPESIFSQEGLQLIHELTEDSWLVKDIVRVDSISNYNAVQAVKDDILIEPFFKYEKLSQQNPLEYYQGIKEKVLQQKDLKNYLIDPMGKMGLIYLNVKPSFDKAMENEAIYAEIESMIAKYQKKYPQFELIHSGPVMLTEAFRSATFSDIAFLLPLCYFIFTIFLLILYRSKLGVLGPWVIISSSITMMIGFLGYLGFKINSMSSAAPTILLTVAIADSIHILSSYYYSFRQGLSAEESAIYSLRKNFFPTLLTSITTSIGFISFFGAKVQPVAELGALVSAGVMVAWFNTYFFLGPLLIKLKGIKDQSIFALNIEDKLTAPKNTFKLDLTVITPMIKNHYNKILIASLILFVSGLYFATKLEVNMNPFEQFRDEHKIVQNKNFVEKYIGGTTNLEFMINTAQGGSVFEPEFIQKVEQFEQFLLSQSYIYSTTSILDVLRNTHQKLNGDKKDEYRIVYDREGLAQEYLFYTMGLPAGKELNNLISIGEDSLRLVARWNVHHSKEALQYKKQLENYGKELGLDLVLTGKMPLFHDLTPYVVSTFFESFILAFALITILLILILGSIKIGLMALIPNIFPLSLGAALVHLTDRDVNMTISIIASVVIGIAVDDTIHFLFEYRRYERKGLSVEEILNKILRQTGPALFYTTMMISTGFLTLWLGEYKPNRDFGLFVSLLLIFALYADFFILPALFWKLSKNTKVIQTDKKNLETNNSTLHSN